MTVPLTSRDGWNARYHLGHAAPWMPRCADDRDLAAALLAAAPANCRRIIEVGCGGSRMLPWLALRLGAYAVGVDYAPEGCALAREQMRLAGATGEIICADLRSMPPIEPGDLVFSLGVVEHFADPVPVIALLAKLVGLQGRLFTEIPNLTGLHGLAMRHWQPAVWAEHRPWTPRQLADAHLRAGLAVERSGYLGRVSLGIVAWNDRPRQPCSARWLDPLTRRLPGLGSRYADLLAGCHPWSAPFVGVTARRCDS